MRFRVQSPAALTVTGRLTFSGRRLIFPPSRKSHDAKRPYMSRFASSLGLPVGGWLFRRD